MTTDTARRTPSPPPRALLAIGLWIIAAVAGMTVWFLRADSPRVPRAPQLPGREAEVDGDAPAPLATLDGPGRVSAVTSFAQPGGIEIPAGVRLTGDGWLEGRALDRADGSPLAHVRIDLLPLPPAGAQAFGRLLRLAKTGDDLVHRVEPVAITGTDASGRFRFEGVRAGRYFVEARGTRHVADGVAHAQVLASGRGGPVDVWMRAGGRVIGRVERPDGAAAAGSGVSITAGPTFALEAARTGDIVYLETRADTAGEFVFCGVPAGADWQVTAWGGEFALTHLPDITVRAGEDTRVVLRTQPGARIVGRIVSGPGVGEAASAASAEALVGAHVGVVPRGLRDLSYAGEVLRATHGVSDAEGRYTIDHVTPGEVDVLAIAPGHVAAKGPRVIAAVGGQFVAEDFVLPRGPVARGQVVDSAGAPIEGVVVRWNAVDLRNFNFDFSFAPLLAQAVEGFEFPKTDAEGRFEAGAFPGEKSYRIEFSKLGYRNARLDWDPQAEPSPRVTLQRGGAIEGVVMDAARARPLTRFTIHGKDRIDTDAGAPGRMNPFAGGQEVEHPTGAFRVASVAPGSRSLQFKSHGYLPKTIDGIEVVEGETTKGVIVELLPGGVVRGVIRNREGEPVVGAQVFANAGARFRGFNARDRGPFGALGGDPAAGEPPEFGDPEQLPPGLSGFLAQLGMLGDRAVLSGADGRFELANLAAGEVVIFASHRDYVLAKSTPLRIEPETEPVEVELRMSRGSALFGRATDRFARPVPGAIVLALSPANLQGQASSAGGGFYQGNTDVEGRYSIDHIAPGGYFVLLTRGDQALNPMSFLGNVHFDLVHVPPEERVEFDLVDSSSGATRVFGVVSAAGARLSAGSIGALGFESESLLGVEFKLAQIQPDGSYQFAGLAPGAYTFQITDSGRARRQEPIRVSVEVPDQPEARIDVELPQGAIAGRVVDANGGEGVEGAEVVLTALDLDGSGSWIGGMLSRESAMSRARTRASGEFRIAFLEPGRYRLSVRAPRRAADANPLAQPEPQEFDIDENEALDGLRIELTPAVELHGSVQRRDGEPIAGVEILARATHREGVLPERTRTDAEGRFSITGLAAGRYDLTADKDGFAGARREGVEVSAGGDPSVDFVLERGVEARVRVLGSGGEPIAGARGRLIAPDAAAGASVDAGRALTRLFSGQGVSNTQGLLDLGNFAPGKYTLEVSRGDQRARQAVELEEGGAVTFTVRLQ